ncbi:transcriptional regulator GcvA [Dongia mobilis]|uniref:transcriptional regulator GcvA n=1 Tax=Dongia sp. TaxID=1977262 RepID=UPI0026EE7171
MARDLPNLLALRAFEAAGRHLSFTLAAEELSLTQGAISRHVRGLEEELGQKLFHRRVRSLELTPQGEAYLGTVRQAFDLLASGSRQVRAARAERRLKVALTASFAANWLLPRLARFTAAHPEIGIDFEPGVQIIDLSAEGIDAAIRYGSGTWTGLDATALMQEEVFPVCSPALLAKGLPLAKVADLAQHNLLLSGPRSDWEDWAAAAGLDLKSVPRQTMLYDYNLVLQAALDGMGVALGRRILVEERLRSGELVQPLAQTLRNAMGYYLVTLPARRGDQAIDAFRAWLRAEAGDA